MWLLQNWKVVLVAAVIGSMGFYAGLMHVERDAVRAEYADYRGKVAEEAAAAANAALAHAVADERKKEEADRENADALATLARTVGELRRAADSRDVLPAAPAATLRPELACFDRPLLERALEQYRADVRGLIDEGAAATVNLDSAKRWAKP